MYGPKYVGAIHGRFLLAATVSTIVGPGLLLRLRSLAEADALKGKIHWPRAVEEEIKRLLGFLELEPPSRRCFFSGIHTNTLEPFLL